MTCLPAYTLDFDHLDGDRNLAPREIVGATAAELAQAVHRHSRGYLGGRRVDVHLNPEKLTGTILSNGAAVGTFALHPVQPEPSSARDPMHGYTLDDLHQLTTAVLRFDRWHVADSVDRYDAVWHALAEHLCTSEQPPTRRGLISVGLVASNRHVQDEMHHHGKTFAAGSGPEAMPGFERFWHSSPTPSPEMRIVERLACEQVWPLLTTRQREVLEALAVHGTYQAAADAIGLNLSNFNSLIRGARRRFYRWWHEGETAPRRAWRKDQRVSAATDTRGKLRLTVSQVEALRARYEGGEKLRAVAAEAGVPRSTLSALLRGTRKPAPDPVESAAA